MKIVSKNLSKGSIRVKTENPDDLWYLNQIIEPEDVCRSKTIRKLKIGDENNPRIVKKTILLTISVEKLEFQEYTGNLRVAGKIIDGPDDIPRGNYHTFNVEVNKDITIIKKYWSKYLLDKLKEAQKTPAQHLIVLFDRENAMFAELKRRSCNILSEFNVKVSKKDAPDIKSENIYKKIIKQIQEYLKKRDYQNIILGSSNFWKKYIAKELPEELKKKTVYVTVSNIDKAGLNELIKSPELNNLLSEERLVKETSLMEKMLGAIAKEKACYGIKETEQKVTEGNVKVLIVSNNFIMKTRQNNSFRRVNKIMQTADKINAEIHILSSEEASKQLDNLGGIAGILRW